MIGAGNIGIPGDGGAAGGRFSPRGLTGNVLWLRADLGITLNGGDVSAWADQSGTAHHATQGIAGRQMTFVASAGAGNKPVLRGKVSGTTGMDVVQPTIAGAMTLFMVITKPALALAYILRGASAASSDIIGNFAGSAIEYFSASGVDRGVFAAVPAAGQHIITLTQVDGNSCVGRYDRAAGFSLGPTAIVTGPTLIGNDSGYANGADCDFAEIIVYNRALATTERDAVERYLATRYAIP